MHSMTGLEVPITEVGAPWGGDNVLEERPPQFLLHGVPMVEQRLPPHLEGVEEEGEEHLDVAQDACGLLISGEDEDNLVDPKEGDEGERSFGQPERE